MFHHRIIRSGKFVKFPGMPLPSSPQHADYAPLGSLPTLRYTPEYDLIHQSPADPEQGAWPAARHVTEVAGSGPRLLGALFRSRLSAEDGLDDEAHEGHPGHAGAWARLPGHHPDMHFHAMTLTGLPLMTGHTPKAWSSG